METKKNKRKGFNWRRAISASGNLFQFHKNYNNRQFKSQSTIGVKSEKESESRRRYQVGLKSRVHHVTDILHTEPLKSNHDVFMLVICGEEGIGKTTIATVVYRELLCRFESGSFIANVKEIGKNTNGIVRLQQKLLSDICNGREIQIDNVENGKSIIDKTLSRRKVFVVLDDVDAFDQLNALCGSVSWFGKGSRIIITTNHEGLLNGDWRNEGWLNKNWVTSEYIVRKLDVTESLELLSWYAFKEEYPEEDFEELLRAAVDLCKGLPLALEVLGSYLFGRKIAEWESALEILLNDRGLDIMNLLKVGFYGCDDMVKYIFLNICDSYIGKDRDNTVKQLEEIGFSAEIGIDVLEQRCLLSMDMENKFMMHWFASNNGKPNIS
ncbi:Disease resistance protein (TIR-NBS-LRR class) [Quillaja saponaria]|uniref:Disease resistance protein (TIR-NBS-LRR class) n=1 Tax=Quillaja saponaria TaxID=32244 RepID=A0AAD7PNW5_QUISA|nr:Disease resistance protein (TIR-NBS-LRR class) [Quillaja saponaria]